jgi:two-component system, OmpR family, sensor histidine kinase KdpD
VPEDRIGSRRSRDPGLRRASAFIAALSGSLLLLALLTGAALALRLNAASAGFLLLVGVLLVGSRQPLPVASVAALFATFNYNFFFFPPTRTMTIDDPENWIALGTFLVTSLLANRLLVRERLQAESARSNREVLEALYGMSVALLKDAGDVETIGAAAADYLARVGGRSGGVILFGASPQQQRVLAWAGAPMTDEVEDIAAGVGRHGRVTDIPSRFGRDVCVPLAVGGRVQGALLIRGPEGSTSALESAANLLAFAIERERFLRERAHVEALQETNELKTSLLHAVSHDLKSPLTVLSVESEALERIGTAHPAAATHVRAIRDEVARLHRRIDNLLSVARLEAGMISPRTEPTPAADLFRAARESLPTITAARIIETTVSDETPDLLVDPSLALEIVVNLIENAHHASPASRPVELSATPSGETEGRVWLEVRDRGAGLSPEQTKRVRTIDSPDARSGGLGIELARTLAVLSGGSVEWFDRPGGGTVARVDLPADRSPVQEAAS